MGSEGLEAGRTPYVYLPHATEFLHRALRAPQRTLSSLLRCLTPQAFAHSEVGRDMAKQLAMEPYTHELQVRGGVRVRGYAVEG